MTFTLVAILASAACSSESGSFTNGADGRGGSSAGDREPASEIVLIVDTSGSMGASIGDMTRSQVANDAFDRLMDSLDSDTVMGLVLMPGGCSSRLEGVKPTPLVPDVIEHYRQVVDNSTITSQSSAIGPPSTPVGDTLAAVASAFSVGALDRSVVLISDGEEGCGNPPCDVAEELIDQGIDIQVEAVGFQISDVGAEQLTCVANTTGGTYYDIDDASELERALQDAASGGTSLPWWAIILAILGAFAIVRLALRFARD